MHGCATSKVGPDANASPRCNCREAIHTFSRRASVYALGSDMKIDEGTFPNSSVGDCFLPSPLHNFLLRPFSCCLPVNMHAGFLIRALLDTPHHHPSPPKNLVGQDTLNGGILPDRKIMQSQNQDHQQPQYPLRHPPKTHVDLDRLNVSDVGRAKKLILRLKMFLQFNTGED